MAPVPAHAAGDAARRLRLFPAGGSGGQQSDCQQPAGYLKPRAAGLPAGRGAGVRPRFRLAAAGAALAEQFSAVATGAVYLSTYLLVGYRPDPALLVQLRWIPVINPGPLEGLILPVIAVALPISAPLAQILMRSMDQVAVQPFVAVARAKGMSETGVLWRHVMGNALLPALNIAGLLLGELIAGALITETVFGRSGLGQLTQQAVNNQDIAVLQAVVMISALGFVLINLLVDLVMPRLDPRLHLQTGGAK
ncbi:TPA: ABC transporter permease [Klebsiella pneumoniae]|nr:ABC transporter permease [Klebsiella pneumoniae]